MWVINDVIYLKGRPIVDECTDERQSMIEFKNVLATVIPWEHMYHALFCVKDHLLTETNFAMIFSLCKDNGNSL